MLIIRSETEKELSSHMYLFCTLSNRLLLFNLNPYLKFGFESTSDLTMSSNYYLVRDWIAPAICKSITDVTRLLNSTIYYSVNAN